MAPFFFTILLTFLLGSSICQIKNTSIHTRDRQRNLGGVSKPLRVDPLYELTAPIGYSFHKVLPSSNLNTNAIIAASGDNYKLIQADPQSKITYSQEFGSIVPQIFSSNHYNSHFILNIPEATSTIDLLLVPPSARPLSLLFKIIYIVKGNYMYGVENSGLPSIWNIKKPAKRIRSLKGFDVALLDDSCTFLTFADAFFCNYQNTTTRYVTLPVVETRFPSLDYFNFRADRPFEYKDNHTIGCHGDPTNIYCEIFEPMTNSSSLFTLKNAYPLPFVNGYKYTVLPIAELDIIVASLKNKTLSFYDIGDLDTRGNLLYSYSTPTLEEFYKPVFSNSSFVLSVQTNLNKLRNFQIQPRFSIPNCKYYYYAVSQCYKCLSGFKLDSSSKQCFKIVSLDVFVTTTILGMYLEPDQWKITPIKKLGKSVSEWELKVNFDNKTAEDQFYDDFEIKKNLAIKSYEYPKLYNYLHLSSKKFPNKIKIYGNYLQTIDFSVIGLRLRDSPKNGEINIVRPVSSRIQLKNRNLQTDGFSKQITINPVIHPKQNIYYFPLNMKIIFLFARILQIILIIFLFLTPLLPKLSSIPRSTWIIRVIIIFQILSFLSLIPVYCYRKFDEYMILARSYFEAGIFGLRSTSLEGYFPSIKIDSDPEGIFGKVYDQKMEISYTMIQNFEIIIYSIFVLCSGISSLFNSSQLFSSWRLITCYVTFVSNLIFSGLNFYYALFFINVNPWIKLYALSGILFSGIQILDLILSFNSPTFQDGSFLRALYPQNLSCFKVFSYYNFQDEQDLNKKLVPLKFIVLTSWIKWGLLSIIIVMTIKSPLYCSIALEIWALVNFYFTLSQFSICAFTLKFQLLLKFIWDILFIIFGIILLCFTIDPMYKFLNFSNKEFLVNLIFLVYNFLWITALIEGVYLLFSTICRYLVFTRNNKDYAYIVKEWSIQEDNGSLMEAGFMETKKEKALRERVKRMNPYDFWIFVRSNIGQSEANRTIYYQATQESDSRGPTRLRYGLKVPSELQSQNSRMMKLEQANQLQHPTFKRNLDADEVLDIETVRGVKVPYKNQAGKFVGPNYQDPNDYLHAIEHDLDQKINHPMESIARYTQASSHMGDAIDPLNRFKSSDDADSRKLQDIQEEELESISEQGLIVSSNLLETGTKMKVIREKNQKLMEEIISPQKELELKPPLNEVTPQIIPKQIIKSMVSEQIPQSMMISSDPHSVVVSDKIHKMKPHFMTDVGSKMEGNQISSPKEK